MFIDERYGYFFTLSIHSLMSVILQARNIPFHGAFFDQSIYVYYFICTYDLYVYIRTEFF
jgi:hypothetical protein